MTTSDIAAWWGAGLATLVFAWDVYKWLTAGSHLAIKASPNMQTTNDPRKGTYVFVEVINRGERLVTITHLIVYKYASFLHRLARRRNKSWLVPNPGGGAGLPHELEPGKRWTALVDQEGLAKDTDGLLYVVIAHSGSKREIMARLRFRASL